MPCRNDMIKSKVDVLRNVSDVELAFSLTCREQASSSDKPLCRVLDSSPTPCSSRLGGQRGLPRSTEAGGARLAKCSPVRVHAEMSQVRLLLLGIILASPQHQKMTARSRRLLGMS